MWGRVSERLKTRWQARGHHSEATVLYLLFVLSVLVVPLLSTAGLKTGSTLLEPTGPWEVIEELAGSGDAPGLGIHGCG